MPSGVCGGMWGSVGGGEGGCDAPYVLLWVVNSSFCCMLVFEVRSGGKGWVGFWLSLWLIIFYICGDFDVWLAMWRFGRGKFIASLLWRYTVMMLILVFDTVDWAGSREGY